MGVKRGIDIQAKNLIAFSKAAGVYPGGGVHLSTLHRHRLRGLCGQKLEAVFVAGQWRTTIEAIEKFVLAVNDARSGASAPSAAASNGQVTADADLVNDGF
jgi:hypothetical protein